MLIGSGGRASRVVAPPPSSRKRLFETVLSDLAKNGVVDVQDDEQPAEEDFEPDSDFVSDSSDSDDSDSDDSDADDSDANDADE